MPEGYRRVTLDPCLKLKIALKLSKTKEVKGSMTMIGMYWCNMINSKCKVSNLETLLLLNIITLFSMIANFPYVLLQQN